MGTFDCRLQIADCRLQNSGGFQGIRVGTSSVCAAILLAAFAGVGGAQDAQGTVRDAVTDVPVSGAVVILTGANRQHLVRTITSSSGTFRLRHGSASAIRVMRIGYTPHEQTIDSSGGPLTIALIPLGRNLRPVAVNTQPVCPARVDQREALAIWSSATDGMLAMVVASTESSQSGTVKQLLYNRLFSSNGRSVTRQSVQRVITENASPIRADRDPDEFVETGYVVRRGYVTTYYGPDPEVLLDSTFAATHCLSIQTDPRAHPGEVGVAFRPTLNRDTVPDIAGVLWLTRSPMAIRSLTFAYRGVDEAIIDARAGGRLDFETLSNGVPVIRSWFVRSPKLGYQPTGRYVDGRLRVEGERARILELYETGGMITGGQLADGTVLTASLATLGGRVLNARTDEPVPGARVTIDSTDYVAVADRLGQFAVEDVLPGPYTLRVRDSTVIVEGRLEPTQETLADTRVQQVVFRIATATVEARIGQVAPLDVRLPWRSRVAGCGTGEEVEQRYFVVGDIRSTRSEPVPNARIRLAWADTSRGTTVETLVDAVSDAGGRFFMCGIPAEIPLVTRVITSSGSEHRGATKVTRVDYDEQGKRRTGTLRAIKLVIP
jgi:hypothetical protein